MAEGVCGSLGSAAVDGKVLAVAAEEFPELREVSLISSARRLLSSAAEYYW